MNQVAMADRTESQRQWSRTPQEHSRGRAFLARHRLVGLIVAVLLGAGGAYGIWAVARNDQGPTWYGYEVVRVYPHDPKAFCQGLEFVDGRLYEGTGLYGQSTLREVELETGKVLRQVDLPANLFGEGITVWGDRIIQLTWENRLGLVYDRKTFKPVGRFRYNGEGWGLANDGTHLIMSDGSATLRFLDPKSFRVVRRVTVRDQGQPVKNVNELEFIKDEIYANIWNSEYVARIDPKTGDVVGWIDLRGLLTSDEQARLTGSNAVLNGIAYDERNGRFFVTGKNWPKLFELRIVPKDQ